MITNFLQPRIDKTCWLAVKRQNHGAGRVLSTSSYMVYIQAIELVAHFAG